MLAMKMTTRRLMTVAAALFAAVLMAVFGPLSTSQAAQGQKWSAGVPWAGFVKTNTMQCTVTVVSEYLAITAKHCGIVDPQLKLNIADLSTPGHDYAVKEVLRNRDMDVEALVLRNRSGLSVTPLSETVKRNRFYSWGYGFDWSHKFTRHLTRADFQLPEQCPAEQDPAADGNLCWQTDAKNSVCIGDSGGPVTQDGHIIAILTQVEIGNERDCGTVSRAQALTVQQLQPWLNQMIKYADPFD